MPVLRVALAQTNPVLGDIDGNCSAVLRWSRKAADQGASLVAFPELAVTGGPLRDLGSQPAFAAASAAGLTRLAADLAAEGLGKVSVVVGYLEGSDSTQRADGSGCAAHNAVALLRDGHVVGRSFKHRLPHHGVFDEVRNFLPGNSLMVACVDGTDVALAVGEDIHAPAVFAEAGAGLVLQVCAAPYHVGGHHGRMTALARLARAAGTPVASVNAVGGQDELVFHGGSSIVAADGSQLATAAHFVEDLLVAELDLPAAGDPAAGTRRIALPAPKIVDPPPQPIPVPRHPPAEPGEVWQALVTGTRDYARKNGFASAVVALSGGIDSTVVAVIAADALGPENVLGISMPSVFSSDHSMFDAEELGQRVGLDFRVVPIQPVVDSVAALLPVDGVALENVQARARGMLLMAVSNQEGRLALNTGNKTEYSCGHNTLYGDQVGGYAPLKDVPKTLVWALARWRNAQAYACDTPAPVPERTITKEPSPELQPGQVDSQLLPAPYEVLDRILARYVEDQLSRDELVADGFDADVVDCVIEMVERGEFKRQQAPPGPKISVRAFGMDRRMPITNRFVVHGHSASYFPAPTVTAVNHT
ncbi:NAD+ synthase [Micromonospora sp. NPDC023814]|uniref:NAD+ synthase n=1 Tax=Micromonospora sp. NPDC023814 TaxID=3154596 RepID=UPI0033F9F1B6